MVCYPPNQFEAFSAFYQFLKNEIFDPLKMNDTYFFLPFEKKERLAKVYSSTKNGIKLGKNMKISFS